MLVQYLVFSTLFRSAIDHFPVYLISGIIVFSFFTECVTLGMDAIVMNASLITKVAIPKLIFPFSRALSSLINFLISLLPLLLLMLLTGVRVSPALLLLPLMIALLFLFALGVTLVMATLNVFLPRYAIPVERDFALVDVCDADFLSGYDLAGGTSGDFPFEPDVSDD